jgi:hypothetical protein
VAESFRPGYGLLLGATGLLSLCLSLFVLPWAEGGRDVTFPDIRDAYAAMDDQAPPSVVSGTGAALPDGPNPVEGVGSFGTDYLEIYLEGIWALVLGVSVVAVVVAALWVPATQPGRMMLGFACAGVLGLAANAADKRGHVAPRLVGAVLAGAALVAHVWAVRRLFGQDGAPDPTVGVWAGPVGLALVVVGCIVGTRAVPAGQVGRGGPAGPVPGVNRPW